MRPAPPSRPARPALPRAGRRAPRAASAPRCRRPAASGSRSATASSTRSTIRASTSACTRDLGLIVCRRRRLFLRGEAPRRPRRSSLSRTALPAYRLVNTALDGTLSHRKAGPGRSRRGRRCCRRSASRALDGATGRLSRLRPAGAASGQCRLRQHRLDRRLQGHARCCLRPGAAACRWRSPRSLPWRAARPAMSASPTAGSSSSRHGRLDPAYQRAENGNVALTGEIGFSAEHSRGRAGARLRRRRRRGRPTMRCASLHGGLRAPPPGAMSPAGATGRRSCCRSTARRRPG